MIKAIHIKMTEFNDYLTINFQNPSIEIPSLINRFNRYSNIVKKVEVSHSDRIDETTSKYEILKNCYIMYSIPKEVGRHIIAISLERELEYFKDNILVELNDGNTALINMTDFLQLVNMTFQWFGSDEDSEQLNLYMSKDYYVNLIKGGYWSDIDKIAILLVESRAKI